MLLVSRAADTEAARLAAVLRQVGVPCVRLDAEAAGATEVIVDPAAGVMCVHDLWIRPAVTWVRHFSARVLADHRSPAYQAFLRDSWQALMAQLVVVSGTVVRSHGPGLLAQLALAARHGIRVPRTIVATAPVRAAALLPARRHLVKALHQHFVEASPGLLTGVFPELIDQAAADQPGGRAAAASPAAPAAPVAPAAPAAPVVVQEYVEHDTEIRAYYAGGEVLAFTVSKDSAADPWLRPDRVAVRQAEPPAAVAAAARQLARAMSLEYAAFDFLISDGTPTFLEADPTGDWRWIERRVNGLPVTNAVARMLRGMYARSAAGSGATMAPIELTTFLSGA